MRESDSQVNPCQAIYSQPQNIPEIANHVTLFCSRGQPKRLYMHFHLPREHPGHAVATLGSLSTRVFETRTATGSELFSLLTCLHTTEFALPSIFSPLEMLDIKIWETPLSWHAKCPLPVAVRVSKTCVLKLPNIRGRTGYYV